MLKTLQESLNWAKEDKEKSQKPSNQNQVQNPNRKQVINLEEDEEIQNEEHEIIQQCDTPDSFDSEITLWDEVQLDAQIELAVWKAPEDEKLKLLEQLFSKKN